jgi:succinylglutamic semialdehyde dehydrogenase
MDERFAHLREAQGRLAAQKEELARAIAVETGKPLTEARGEVGAVIAKFDLTIQDAGTELPRRAIADGTSSCVGATGCPGTCGSRRTV